MPGETWPPGWRWPTWQPGGADAGAMMAAMTPAMSMSFLLPGIGLGLLKGMLFGKELF